MQTTKTSYRHTFIRELFPKLYSLRYGFLKYFYQHLDEIPATSDIDLIVDKTELPHWRRMCGSSPYVDHVVFRQTSFALFCELYFRDGSYLELDLIYAFKWKGVVFMNIEEVLRAVRPNDHRVKVPPVTYSFAYIFLFFGLNKAEVPAKYQFHFQSLPEATQQEVQNWFVKRYLSGKKEVDVFDLRPCQKNLLQACKRLPENKGIPGWKSSWYSRLDAVFPPAPLITFSGVDGAGKSTVLEHTRKLLEEKYRREVTVLRQRPGILPILSALKYGAKEAEKRAAERLPRTGQNNSFISSLMRFAYYYCDYQIGQWWVRIKYRRKNSVILYDRYYFDFMADGRRNNLKLPKWLLHAGFRFVTKPGLNFLLFADPEVILARKQELSESAIIELTQAYQEVFKKLDQAYPGNQYHCINNLHLEATLNLIEKGYVNSTRSTDS
ncbi:MAG: hypothetical protein AAGI38_09350 [Bacteroidota bacterium]